MKSKIISIPLILGLILLAGCKKPGCTDFAATNYSSDAKEDDGSCIYNGEVYFYYLFATQDNFQALGITEIDIYVDNELLGSYSTDTDPISFSNCDALGIVSKSFDFILAVPSDSPQCNKVFQVRNANTDVGLITQEFTVYNSSCVGVEIVY